jgi:hypothetical protein
MSTLAGFLKKSELASAYSESYKNFKGLLNIKERLETFKSSVSYGDLFNHSIFRWILSGEMVP